MPAFLLASALALKYPRLASFLKRFGKWIFLALLVIAAILSFNVWKGNLVEAANAAGFARAEEQFTAAVNEANAREQVTQGRLDQMVVTFGHVAFGREQEINLTLKPMIERIEREVATDPRYRECATSDSVLGELNAGRASVDASITASNP